MTEKEKIRQQTAAGILGLAIGDALGVPVEFMDRKRLNENPVTAMRAFGSHNQPKGTWSDDSSLTFCLMEALIDGYNLDQIAAYFKQWKNEAFWTPHGVVFDIGISTKAAINEISKGMRPDLCGGMDEWSNGNGSLMRILPLAFFLYDEHEIKNRYQKIKEVSSITHAHARSVIACFIYVEYVLELLAGSDRFTAVANMQKKVNTFLVAIGMNKAEVKIYANVLEGDISKLSADEIRSSGYVVHSLEASLWSFLTTASFEEAVLTAVNLGEDTDTTAAITGGLAGVYYPPTQKVNEWTNELVQSNKIKNLVERFNKAIFDNRINA